MRQKNIRHLWRKEWSTCTDYSLMCYVLIKIIHNGFSKNGGGALSVTPVRACVRPSVSPLSKFGVSSILKDCIDSIQIWYVDI